MKLILGLSVWDYFNLIHWTNVFVYKIISKCHIIVVIYGKVWKNKGILGFSLSQTGKISVLHSLLNINSRKMKGNLTFALIIYNSRDSNLVDSASSIRLSQRLSHACLSINNFILWNCEWLIISVIVYLMVLATWITVVILELIHALNPDFWKGCIY